jgi:hypothetical protein
MISEAKEITSNLFEIKSTINFIFLLNKKTYKKSRKYNELNEL